MKQVYYYQVRDTTKGYQPKRFDQAILEVKLESKLELVAVSAEDAKRFVIIPKASDQVLGLDNPQTLIQINDGYFGTGFIYTLYSSKPMTSQELKASIKAEVAELLFGLKPFELRLDHVVAEVGL